MIITYFNMRGLGGGSKFTSLKRLFSVIKSDMVFIQETMSEAKKSCSYFLKLFHGWEVCAIDAVGNSGGLFSICNMRICDMLAFSSTVGILLDGRLKGYDKPIRLINCYGPYRDKETFWKTTEDIGLLCDHDLIVGGNLNLTLSDSKCWGTHRMDPLA